MSESQKWEWIVPFKGRNHSGWYDQNFLCKFENVYVMDNHRAALWCWLQEVDLCSQHSLIHLDRHFDTLQSRLDEWVRHLPSWRAGIDVYLNAEYTNELGTCTVIDWANYLSIYLDQFAPNINEAIFLTHNDGDKPNYNRARHYDIWDLPGNLESWLDPRKGPWIVNIDLDYFYFQVNDRYSSMFSDSYLKETFKGLKEARKRGAVGVVTVCLTPDGFTPGWRSTERLASKILALLEIEFSLPAAP